MTKCRIIWSTPGRICDLEDAINNFIADKEIISVSFTEVGRFPNVIIIYKED